MADKIIELTEVTKTYKVGEVEISALSGVNLTIEAGQFVVILGPSGSGKTTLLNLIGGLDNASSGSMLVEGRRLGDKSEQELTLFRKSKIGFVFQFFNLIPTLTAFENIALSAELSDNHGLTPDQVLAEVGLAERKDHFPSQLSGGEQQRIAIARALAQNTPVLLCDEPTGELDFETGIKILALLRKINKEMYKTFLLVTHNAAIGQMADRVLKLRSGKLVTDDIIKNPLDASKIVW